jgi:hypothetical protein
MSKKLSELYEPKPKGEKEFVAKHKVKEGPTDKKVGTNDPKLFKGSNVKTYDRSPRHGYNSGEDEKANDGTTGVNDQRSPPGPSTLYPSGTFKEEAERLDELSPKTLRSYSKKAGGYGRRSSWGLAQKGEKEEDKSMSTDGNKYPEKQERHQKAASKLYHKSNNRDKGLERAKQRLKEDAAQLTEDEVDYMLELIDAYYGVGEIDEISGRGMDRMKSHLQGQIKTGMMKAVPGPEQEAPAVAYNKSAVDTAIKNNRTGKIGKKEARAIHGLLKGWRGK